MKIGIYGGSFNPVHFGHTGLAEWVLGHTDLDEIWFMVSPNNPPYPVLHTPPTPCGNCRKPIRSMSSPSSSAKTTTGSSTAGRNTNISCPISAFSSILATGPNRKKCLNIQRTMFKSSPARRFSTYPRLFSAPRSTCILRGRRFIS